MFLAHSPNVMEAKIVAASPDLSFRRLITRFIGNSSKQERHVAGKPSKTASANNELISPVGNESPTNSIAKSSTEVILADVENPSTPSPENQNHQHRVAGGKKGNLWTEEGRRKNYSELKDCIEEALQNTAQRYGFCLKYSDDLPQRITESVASISSSELCGLRGSRVHLRLLHEDIADTLLTSSDGEETIVLSRKEKCASWPDESRAATHQPPVLTFADLPDVDTVLTKSLNLDLDNDSRSFEMPNRTLGRNKRSLSSLSLTPVLHKLSSASPLGAACADLGRFVMCDSSAALTFEIYVYLTPVVSWTWKVQRWFFSSMKPGDSDESARPSLITTKTLTVEANFTLVKKKLYRARSASPEVVRCTPKS